jgi:hypothetical protein
VTNPNYANDPEFHRLKMGYALKRYQHPAVKEGRWYYLLEFRNRLLRAALMQGPAFALLFPAAVSLADYLLGHPPFFTVLEYARSHSTEVMFKAAAVLYGLGFIFSAWDGLIHRPWYSPFDQTIDLYLDINDALHSADYRARGNYGCR